MKFNVLKGFAAMVLAAALSGCSAEELLETPGPGAPGAEQVQITVTVPGAATPTSRGIAGGGGEAVVRTLDVLVFKKNSVDGAPDVLAERVVGRHVSQRASNDDDYRATFVATLTPDPDATTVAVVANASAQASAAAVGAEKQAVLAALTVDDTDGWGAVSASSFQPVPMYGEKAVSGISSTSGATRIEDIQLVRTLARVDEVNSADNFTLTNVYLYGVGTGYLAPPWNPSNGVIVAPQPAAPMLLTRNRVVSGYPSTDGADLIGEIYTFDNPASTGPTSAPMETPGTGTGTFLVVEGTIDGDATPYFYRIDFTDPAGDPAPAEVPYMPVHRNHLYRFDITQVDGVGYTGRDEASTAQTVLSNLKTSLLVVDQKGIDEIVFDGQYWLGVDESVFVFPGEGGSLPFNPRTNYPRGWESDENTPWFAVSSSGRGTEDAVPSTITVDPHDGSKPRTDTIELTAGRLSKTITVVQMPLAENIAGDDVVNVNMARPFYVGAFWKADQTGERLIRNERRIPPASFFDFTLFDGAWAVLVIEGEDWIELDTRMTTDLDVGWLPGAVDGRADYGNDLDFDVRHRLEEGRRSTHGTFSEDEPLMYFRLGLKSTYTPTAAAPARYGMVLVAYNNYTKLQRIWVRQGEDPDYLLPPDYPTHSAALTARTAAAKFSPYNLTADTFKRSVDRASSGANPVRFTDYPTQVGGYFQFGSDEDNVVLNRFIATPYYDGGIPWPYLGGFSRPSWTAIEPYSESCPLGYTLATGETVDFHRPSDGLNSRPSGATTYDEDLEYSEIRHSLMVTPTEGFPGTAVDENISQGYYADGFFDRRAVTTASLGYSAVVSKDNAGVAYRGVLLFNPESHASLFFPAGGIRDIGSNNGNVIFHGTEGYYWTTTFSKDESYALKLSYSSGSTPSAFEIKDHNVLDGLMIRCVVAD